MQLLKLVESEVQIGIPLPWNVRNQDCALLLAKGYVVRDEAQLEMLLDRGILWTWKRFAPWRPSKPRFNAP